MIAAIEVRQGDLGNALALSSKALMLQRELGDKLSIIRCCALIGVLLARLGHYHEAALALGGLNHLEGSAALAQDTWAINEAQALLEIALLPDPVGETIESTVRPNGLEVAKVRVPLGVVFFMLDSRLRYGHAVWHGFVVAGTGLGRLAIRLVTSGKMFWPS